ncbi:MAG: 5'/3'-nucleotidase SurE [Gammaproteobacteria bacterium]|nr:5'/3'-nucleotidase SurE [Gammaproteobacteria bacterium]MDD9816489.1 5'/3'-nucleotidase SurE [Gammaproteobacteria bacterium]MDD9851912.1 5'/3'-nucleotidase SurE [Gammaproteobacteria bacterium]MDD9870646.1 5'/3'-nucleotidase SurE [Gammaproteobacteria bacterium]
MHILLSNDDGYLSPGLECLWETLRPHARVTVVAPDRDCSGASSSLTLRRPLRVHRARNGFFYVDGTPTDCVHLALTGFMDEKPDMVIAGINHGANLGDDVLYSGTVAAAMEGRFLGYSALAVSLCNYEAVDFKPAAELVVRLVEAIRHTPPPPDLILNINIPDRPQGALRGCMVTRLGYRHPAAPAVRATDPNGREIFWVGPAGDVQDASEGTDFYAVNNGYTSVTPLSVDLTRHSLLPELRDWMRRFTL